MNISQINNNFVSTTAATKVNKSKRNENPVTNPVSEENTNPSNFLADKNYGVMQTKNMQVSFKALPPAPTKTVSEKVGNLFNILRSNDIIIASKSIDNAVDSLEKHQKSFKTVLKRIFFIEDSSMETTLGFKKNLEEREVMNLGDKPICIIDSKKLAGVLNSGESGFLLTGDTIRTGKNVIPYQEQKGISLPIKASFTKFIDFDKEVEPTIQQVNKRSIEKLKETVSKNSDKIVKNKITFANVGGQDKAIKELKKNILYPIKYPEINDGNSMNKAVLLYGPPGTGKSLLAEATANEAGAWHRKINASELDSKFVGESEENWRNLFDEARENQPAIIFIDEFDAVAKKRGGHDVYGDKTLNTILGLMSDVEKNGDEIYMIAATNNRAALDEAAIRAGRFGIPIEVGTPDLKGVRQTLDIHTKKQPMAKDFDYDKIAQRLHNEKATGADIASITKEARNNALERENIYEKMDAGTYKPEDMENLKINNEDFNKAIDSFVDSRTQNTKPRNPIGFNSPAYQK